MTVQAIVDRAGCVSRATAVGSAHPELDISALAAVVQRRYAPARLNGEPVQVVMTVTSTFSLR